MKRKPSKCTIRGRTRWYVDAPDPVTGKRKRTLFETQAAATHRVQCVVNRQPAPTRTLHALVDPDVTLRQFAGHWFFSRVEAGAWRESTQRGYAQHLVLRLCPFRIGNRPEDTLGQQRVRDLRAGHVQALVEGMRRDGFARGTVRVTVLLFTMLLDEAVDQGLLASHPITKTLVRKKLAPLLKPPKGTKPVKAFTAEQVQRFLAASQAHSRLDALYRVGFCTGLRLGELIGLQIHDDQVVLVRGTPVRRLHVERSRGTRTRTLDLRTEPTKSGASRWVDVGPDLGALFDQIKADRKRLALERGWRPVPPWMFVTTNGTPYGQGDVQADFTRVLAHAGLEGLGFSPHSMWHTFACLHIAAGRNPKWLQQQLGHAKITITHDIYGDHFDLHDAQAAEELGATLLGNTAGNGRGG
jgi:integrase